MPRRTLRYWGRAYDGLASFGRLVFLDLLGFAGSRRPSGTYDVDRHLSTIRDTLQELDAADAIVVGHSTGGLIALALGAHSPSLVSSVVGFGVPIFPSQKEARKHIRSLGFMARLMADDLRLGRRICGFMCDHRELARSVAPLLAPRLPAPVAADGVDHNWDSYSGTFRVVVNENRAREWASEMGSRLTLIYGADDRSCPPSTAIATLRDGMTAQPAIIGGCDHHLPLRRARLARAAIARLL